MKIGILGLGYVGMANLAVLLSIGHEVVGYDIDIEKIEGLEKGTYRIPEYDIDKAIRKKFGKVRFSSDVSSLKGMDAYILALPTPEGEDGSCDTSSIDRAIENLYNVLDKETEAFFIVRSTVPVGFASKTALKLKNPKIHIISMPEFVREGSTYYDELDPDRFVVGVSNEEDFNFVKKMRKDAFKRGTKFLMMSNASAEMTKYAANSFLAMKISYINSLARLADVCNCDIKDVAEGIGSDSRIGKAMLGAGIGYGGSCFPKDTKAISFLAKEKGCPLPLVEATIDVNESQPDYFLAMVRNALGGFEGKTIALFGLAFKNGISDIRSSVSETIISALLKEGASLRCFDFSEEAMRAMKKAFPTIRCFTTMELTLQESDALLILTADQRFLALRDDPNLIYNMRGRYIFDGRNVFGKEDFKDFHYYAIGRK